MSRSLVSTKTASKVQVNTLEHFMELYKPVKPEKLVPGKQYFDFESMYTGDFGKVVKVVFTGSHKKGKLIAIRCTTKKAEPKCLIYDGRPWTSLCEKR